MYLHSTPVAYVPIATYVYDKNSSQYLDELDGQGALSDPSSTHHHQFESFLFSTHSGLNWDSSGFWKFPGP